MEATGKLFKISKVTQHTFVFHYSIFWRNLMKIGRDNKPTNSFQNDDSRPLLMFLYQGFHKEKEARLPSKSQFDPTKEHTQPLDAAHFKLSAARTEM